MTRSRRPRRRGVGASYLALQSGAFAAAGSAELCFLANVLIGGVARPYALGVGLF